jgi:lipopolysaccharide export LptBFGC system permease protein LptF
MSILMSALPRLPRGLQTVTFVVAVLAFGVLTVGLGVMAATADLSPELAASAEPHKS